MWSCVYIVIYNIDILDRYMVIYFKIVVNDVDFICVIMIVNFYIVINRRNIISVFFFSYVNIV